MQWRVIIALIPTYRYPIGAVSWELPRGGRDPDESVEEAAIRELLEETGLAAASTTHLGAIYPPWTQPGGAAGHRRLGCDLGIRSASASGGEGR